MCPHGSVSRVGFPLFDFGGTATLLKQKITLPFQSACRAVFPRIKDDLKVQVVPALTWKQPLGVALGLLDVFSVGQPPSVHQAVNVGVYGEGWNTKGLGHHHGGRFVADAWKGFKGFKISGHLACMGFEQTHSSGGCSSIWPVKSAGPDDGFDLVHADSNHLLRRVGEFEQRWGYLIDPFIGALGRQQDGDEQGVRIGMVSGTGGLGYNRWSSSMMYVTFSALFMALRTDGFGRVFGGQPQAEEVPSVVSVYSLT